MYLPEIGDRIKRLRNQRNLSQSELGQLLGVSKSVVSSYENSVHMPPYDVLIHIAQIFSVSTDYLLGVSGNKTICVDGLTDAQVEALLAIVQELKSASEN